MPPGLLVYSVAQCMLLPLSKGTSSVDSAVHRADNIRKTWIDLYARAIAEIEVSVYIRLHVGMRTGHAYSPSW